MLRKRRKQHHFLVPTVMRGFRWANKIILMLIYAHVVDGEGLREGGGFIGVTRPAAAHRQVQDQEKRMVKDPIAALLHRVGAGGEILLAVQVPADLLGSHSTAKTWKSSLNWPAERTYCPPIAIPPE